MPVSYTIDRLEDGSYKVLRRGNRGTVAIPTHFDRLELEQYLKESVSRSRLEQALRTLDAIGRVTIEADLES